MIVDLILVLVLCIFFYNLGMVVERTFSYKRLRKSLPLASNASTIRITKCFNCEDTVVAIEKDGHIYCSHCGQGLCL